MTGVYITLGKGTRIYLMCVYILKAERKYSRKVVLFESLDE